MKYYDWNDEKNKILKKTRGVSFEQVELAIESGDLIDRIKHPNPEKYPNQKVFLVKIEDYIYSIPYIEDNEKIFFKTIIPNGKATKKIFRRQKMKKIKYLDKNEMELAKSLENEEWISDLTEKEKKKYEEYARYSLNKKKRINIRMNERDLKKIQAKAIEEGLPYQSLISMLIHKFNEGEIKINFKKA